MPAEDERKERPRRRSFAPWGSALVYLTIFCLLIAMQYRGGAFTADLGTDSDEPAHVTTSLMVHDYLVQDFPHNPLTFAREFYAHYPKVAIGHWPPLFYICEAVWMLLAGRSRIALLLFVALTGAALLGSIFIEVRRRCSTAAALVSIAIPMSSTMFDQILLRVHSDLLLGLFVFWAAASAGQFMRSRSAKSRNLFWIFTMAALLVNGRGAVLLFLPFFLLPFYPARAPRKWITAGALLLLSLWIPHMFRMASSPSIHTMGSSMWMFIRETWIFATWPAVVLAAVGVKLVFENNANREFWAAMSALTLASLTFYVVVPVPADERYLFPQIIALAVLAGGGVQVALENLSGFNRMVRPAFAVAVAVAAATWIAHVARDTPPKPNPGYRAMVAECLLCGHPISLVGGDASHEGDLIAESSLADPARIHTVLRASKVLARSTWSGHDYHTIFSSPVEVLGYLDRAHVTLVVIQNAPAQAHLQQLRSAMVKSNGKWIFDSRHTAAAGVSLFERAPAGKP